MRFLSVTIIRLSWGIKLGGTKEQSPFLFHYGFTLHKTTQMLEFFTIVKTSD